MTECADEERASRGKLRRLRPPVVLALLLALTPGLADDPPAQSEPAKEPPAANRDAGVGGAPAEEPGATPGGPKPPKSDAAANAGPTEPKPLAPPPPDAAGAAEPESLAPAKPEGDRKKAYIDYLDPNSIVKIKGPENSVVARGRLQMVIPDDEVIIYCNAVDYSGEKTGIATVTGDLKIVTGKLVKKNGLDTIPKPENVVTGDVGYVFTKEKRAVIDNHVVVVHTPEEKAAEGADEVEQAKKDETTLYCDRLTYWYRKGDRKGVAQPRLPNTKIRFEQKTRRGTAGMATFYDFEKDRSETGDVVDLVGGVHGEDDDGQVVDAEVCRLFIDHDISQWYNVKRVVVNIEEKEEKSPAEPAGPPAVPGTGPTPPPATEPVLPGTTPGAEPAPEPEPATEPAPAPAPAPAG